mgnify:FL=1|jgi:hypothetical protein
MTLPTPNMKMPYLTVEELEANFDFVLTLVERGQTFLIKSEKGNCILAPYAEMRPKLQLQQELSSMLDEQLTGLGQSATI